MLAGPESAAPEVTAAPARAQEAPGRAVPGPTSASTLNARMIALQRTAGNRAVAALAGQQRVLQRRRASPRPAPSPNPAWASKGIDNPDADCKAFSDYKNYDDAKATWDAFAEYVPDKITERCGCDLAGEAYAKYLEAKGGTVTCADDGNCISTQLGQDDLAHDNDGIKDRKDPKAVGIETKLIDRWRTREAGIVWYAMGDGKTRSLELDFVEATKGNIETADPAKLTELEVSNELTYKRNKLAGALLFGSGTSDHITADSEYGFDTRHVSGTIKITRTDDGSNPNFIDVDEVFTFYFRVHDALDFCPGNTIKKDDWNFESFAYNSVLTGLSRLEATGMARDLEFNVKYHTTKSIKTSVSKPK